MKLGSQLIMALEPRLMFDGAAVFDAVHTITDDGEYVDAAPAAPAKEVAFIDSTVADYQTLIGGLADGVEVVVLDAGRSGLGQIAEWAASHSGYDTIHIFSHGAAGSLNLGTDHLTTATLADNTVKAELSALGQSLTADGDVMLYGCSVAAGPSGEVFIDRLAAATGSDVAASDDPTGGASQGGDWVLEKITGVIEARTALSAAAERAYDGLLATTSVMEGSTSLSGTGDTDIFAVTTNTPPVSSFSYNEPPNNYIAADSGHYYTITGFDTATDKISVVAWGQSNASVIIDIDTTAGPNAATDWTGAYNEWANNGHWVIHVSAGYVTTVNTISAAGNTTPAGAAITGTGAGIGGSVTTGTLIVLCNSSWGGAATDDGILVFLPGVSPSSMSASNFLIEANASPTLSTPASISLTDTAANDSFANTTGTLSGSDTDGTIAAYGINGGSTGGSTLIGGITYDVSKAGTYGTLYVKSSTGEYAFVPSDSAVNARTTNASETFTVTTTDNGGMSGNATLTVNVTAANDTPTLTAPSAASYTDTAAADSFSNTTGTLTGADRDSGASLSYGISGGTTGGSTNIGGIVYDVSKAGTYGTLYVKSSTGQYVHVPGAAAINAVSANQSESFTVSVSDGALSATQTLSVNITGANDTPVLPTPTAVSYTDTAAADSFSNTTGTLSATDADGGGVTYGISGGTTGGSTNIGGTVYDISKIGSYGTLYVKSGTGEHVFVPNETAINDITANQSETFIVTAVDASSATGMAALTVNLTGANDTPSVTTPTTITLADTSADDSFSNVAGTLSASDSDGSIVSHGITGGANGSTAIGGVTYDVSKVGSYGTLYVKSTTGEYVYVPDAAAVNALAADTGETFTVTATDNGGGTGTATLTVSVTATTDAPTLTATGGSTSYTEGAAGTTLFTGVAVDDAEGDSISTLSLTVSNLSDGADEVIVVDGTNVALTNGNAATTAANAYTVNVAVSGATATVTITKAGNFSTAAAQTLVGGLEYINGGTGVGLTTGNRVVTLIGIRDTGGTANGGSDETVLSVATTVAVQTVNHAPTLSTTTGTPTFTENGSATGLFSGTSIDIGAGDSGQAIQTITFAVSNVTDGPNEIIAIDGTNVALTNGNSLNTGANGYAVSVSVAAGNATVTITKPGDYSASAAESLINGLTYRNTSDAPTAATRVVTLTGIQDSGGSGSGGSDATTLTAHSDVTVVSINDAPTLTTTTGTISVDTPAAASGALFSGTAVSAVETGQSITQLTMTVSGLVDGAAEQLRIDGTAVSLTNGTSGSTAANSIAYAVSVTGSTATVTLTKAGDLSAAEANAVVDGLRYINTNGNATAGSRVVTLTGIRDDGGTASGGQNSASLSLASTVNVVVNDVPVVSGASASGTSITQQTISGVQVTDTISGGSYSVTLTASDVDGQIHLSGVTPTAGANDSNSISFTGTKAEVNGILATLKYTPSDMGTDTITVSVSDLGYSYFGSAKTGTATVTVAIEQASSPVDTPPPPPPPPVTTPGTSQGNLANNAPPVTIVRETTVTDKPADMPTVVRQVSVLGAGAGGTTIISGAGTGSASVVGTGGLGGGTGLGGGFGGVDAGRTGGDGFHVALASRAPGGGDALVVNLRIPDAVVPSAGRVSISIPSDSFAHTRADATVTLTARSANGAALPGWMNFNPRTGTFEGTPPPNFRGEVLVRVTARDNDGREVTQVFKIVVGDTGGARPGGADGQSGGTGQGGVPGRSGALDLPADDKFAEAVQGKSSLADQLREMSQEARLSRQAALFGIKRAGQA